MLLQRTLTYRKEIIRFAQWALSNCKLDAGVDNRYAEAVAIVDRKKHCLNPVRGGTNRPLITKCVGIHGLARLKGCDVRFAGAVERHLMLIRQIPQELPFQSREPMADALSGSRRHDSRKQVLKLRPRCGVGRERGSGEPEGRDS
jgi:hypothetical protein